jgi:hypothetical protein
MGSETGIWRICLKKNNYFNIGAKRTHKKRCVYGFPHNFAKNDRHDLKMGCIDASRRQLQYVLKIRVYTDFFCDETVAILVLRIHF